MCVNLIPGHTYYEYSVCVLKPSMTRLTKMCYTGKHDNSTPVVMSSIESSTQSLDFRLMAVNGFTGREERRNMHTIVTKQSLSNYARQD
jgi:hypothetical protein